MYHRIEARVEPGGIRVALSTSRDTVQDFIYCHQSIDMQRSVARLYGQPLSGRIKIVERFSNERK
jgi:hypothetical protein